MKKSITPLVSIIVPNYNHASFLKQRLETVYNQTFQDFEVILLDDASTDTSTEILEQYKNHPKTTHLIINKQNSGSPFKQWEKGIELAKGKYIWIAESDDYCELDFLEKMMLLFKQNPLVSLGYCQTIDVDKKGKQLVHRIEYTKRFQPNIWDANFVVDGKKFVANYLSEINVIPNASAVIFKKDLIASTIFTPELLQMKMCGDWFFWIQLSLQTKVGFLAEVINCFRNHETISRNHNTIERKKRRLLEESAIRSYLQENKINNFVANQKLYIQWFGLNKISDLFSARFYKIKLTKSTIFTFATKFIKFKLKKQ